MKNIEKLAKETNRDYALRTIRENIINLELKPGTMISEQDIANELNLSRTPVHEALQELSSSKIIEILPQRGSFVSLIDMNLVEEAIFLRSIVESAIAEQACEKATESDINELEENVNLQEFYLSKDNVDKIFELDNEFHKKIYMIANKMQCYFVVKMMNIHHDRLRGMHLHTSNPITVVEEHKLILQTFKDKDPKGSKDMIIKHLSRLHNQEAEIRKKFGDFFA